MAAPLGISLWLNTGSGEIRAPLVTFAAWADGSLDIEEPKIIRFHHCFVSERAKPHSMRNIPPLFAVGCV